MCYRTLHNEDEEDAGESCAPTQEEVHERVAWRTPRYQHGAGAGGASTSARVDLTELFCTMLNVLRPFPEALAAARAWLERLATPEPALPERRRFPPGSGSTM